MDALPLHRIHFGFTITYHYLFPQLTMGLALLIVILKTVALRATDPDKQAKYDVAARFWGKIFGTTIPDDDPVKEAPPPPKKKSGG